MPPIKVTCSLFSLSLKSLPAFCQERSKKRFYSMPTLKVTCVYFGFYLRMVAVLAFCQERSKKGFSIMPTIEVTCLLFGYCLRMIAMPAFYRERSRKFFSIMPFLRIICLVPGLLLKKGAVSGSWVMHSLIVLYKACQKRKETRSFIMYAKELIWFLQGFFLQMAAVSTFCQERIRKCSSTMPFIRMKGSLPGF